MSPSSKPALAPLALTWHGHATTLIELDGVRLLTDPVMGRRVGPLVRVSEPVARGAGEGIDVVLLSHLHADHADVRSLKSLDPETLVIAPPGARRVAARSGPSQRHGARPRRPDPGR